MAGAVAVRPWYQREPPPPCGGGAIRGEGCACSEAESSATDWGVMLRDTSVESGCCPGTGEGDDETETCVIERAIPGCWCWCWCCAWAWAWARGWGFWAVDACEWIDDVVAVDAENLAEISGASAGLFPTDWSCSCCCWTGWAC
jgi:hypothetical protein